MINIKTTTTDKYMQSWQRGYDAAKNYYQYGIGKQGNPPYDELESWHRGWQAGRKYYKDKILICRDSKLVLDLIQALGLDKQNLKAFTIYCRVDEPMIVETEQFVRGSDTLMQKYRIITEEITELDGFTL